MLDFPINADMPLELLAIFSERPAPKKCLHADLGQPVSPIIAICERRYNVRIVKHQCQGQICFSLAPESAERAKQLARGYLSRSML
jgi:hypothetical protein